MCDDVRALKNSTHTRSTYYHTYYVLKKQTSLTLFEVVVVTNFVEGAGHVRLRLIGKRRW